LRIAYYVSGHGFGHISRSSVIWEEFAIKGAEIVVITERAGFFPNSPEKIKFRNQKIDIGVRQRSSLDIDIEGTITDLENFSKQKEQISSEEKSFLKEFKPDIILSDSSSLPFPIAHELKIPAYFIGNFTWDFIYENYIKDNGFFRSIVGELKFEYSLARAGFVLPLHCPIESIPNLIHVGLVGRKPERSKEEVRKDLGFDSNRIYFLFSFGAYGLNPDDFNYGNLKSNYQIVVSRLEGFLGEKVFRKDDIHYPDIVSASDFVITKPGYGIVSECIYGKTPILYTDRGDFAEYPYLVSQMKERIPAAYLTQEELYGFQFDRVLNEIKVKNTTIKSDIDESGAKQILQFFFN
jgi:hypothetical protein